VFEQFEQALTGEAKVHVRQDMPRSTRRSWNAWVVMPSWVAILAVVIFSHGVAHAVVAEGGASVPGFVAWSLGAKAAGARVVAAPGSGTAGGVICVR